MYILSRKNNPDHFQCEICNTVWQKSDLEFDCQHNSVGKYTVKPDVTECPMCGESFNMEQATRKVLAHIKGRTKVERCIKHFPRTKKQNCFSATQEIKPQIDWDKFKIWVDAHGNTIPVPSREDLKNINIF